MNDQKCEHLDPQEQWRLKNKLNKNSKTKARLNQEQACILAFISSGRVHIVPLSLVIYEVLYILSTNLCYSNCI